MPALTILLPTFNRERFLPEAFASIRAQTFTDWELVVVDDGSTDNTRELVERFRESVPQSVRYIHQQNQGAYGARNTGLDAANGRYIAFFDSDDVWLPHHLSDCVGALERNPDVDWAYGACRIVDLGTGQVTAPSTFYISGQPRPFLRLRVRVDGDFRIIDDPKVTECMIRDGTYNGLQNSVIRRAVFERERFHTHFRNEAEDQLIVVRALAANRRLGYFDNVHVIYHEHAANSSAAGSDRRLEKLLDVFRAEARGYEEISSELPFPPSVRQALRVRLSESYFWLIGYSLLWQNGRRREAMASFRRGLAFWPYRVSYWRTFFLCWLRTFIQSDPTSNSQFTR